MPIWHNISEHCFLQTYCQTQILRLQLRQEVLYDRFIFVINRTGDRDFKIAAWVMKIALR